MLVEFMYKDASDSDETLMVIDGATVIACDEYDIRCGRGDESSVAVNCFLNNEEIGEIRTASIVLSDEDEFIDHVNERTLVFRETEDDEDEEDSDEVADEDDE